MGQHGFPEYLSENSPVVFASYVVIHCCEVSPRSSPPERGLTSGSGSQTPRQDASTLHRRPETEGASSIEALFTGMREMLSTAFDASLSATSLSDIAFFDMLVAFVERQPTEDKGPLCRVIRQLLHKLFDLMEKDESEIQMKSLKKLVHLAIEERTERRTEAETAADFSHDIHMRPFFSATFPEGKTVQVDTASLDGMREMANVFCRRQLNLASASLREEILLPPAEMEGTVESADDCSSKNATSLIRTPTTEENLQMIEEVVEYDRPVLLYGASGVGKTATLRELAERKGVNLVRLNMSSNLTPEDFLAKISFDRSGQIVLDMQPFARSFEKGDWVLLDEMNLAEKSALKVVVDALENGVIVLCDQSSVLTPPHILKKHPNFRLFATQNPWQAGKRERANESRLSFPVLCHALQRAAEGRVGFDCAVDTAPSL